MFKHLNYLLCFYLPCSSAWFLYTAPHRITEALAWTIPLWSIIILDWLGPKIDMHTKQSTAPRWFYDAILYTLSLLQLLIISLLLIAASQLQWDTTQAIITSSINLLVMRILVGSTSGSSAIIVAHELIHRTRPHLRFLGRLLLYSVCYEHFVIAHKRGHHFSVATPDDIATATLGKALQATGKESISATLTTRGIQNSSGSSY